MSAPPPPVRPALAVALQYDGRAAPRVVAKGRGDSAAAIAARAREHGVPIEQNPWLAEALADVALDEEIPEELYRAVAEVLGFLLRLGQLRTHPDP